MQKYGKNGENIYMRINKLVVTVSVFFYLLLFALKLKLSIGLRLHKRAQKCCQQGIKNEGLKR
jgi:hypothetical protein